MNEPSEQNDWWSLLIFACKAYLVLVYPFYRIFRIFFRNPFVGTGVSGGTFETFLDLFFVCSAIVLAGVVTQVMAGKWKQALMSLLCIAVPIVGCFIIGF